MMMYISTYQPPFNLLAILPTPEVTYVLASSPYRRPGYMYYMDNKCTCWLMLTAALEEGEQRMSSPPF